MAKSNLIFALILLAHSISDTIGLVIDPDEEELIITHGTNITLKCRHDEPVDWTNRLYEEELEKQPLTVIQKQLSDGSFEASLVFESAHYTDTGFYYCFQSSNNSITQGIYLFVQDKEHLLVAASEYEMIHVGVNEPLLIPCKPTSPYVNVTLDHDGEKIDYFDYDNKIGFRAQKREKVENGLYTCTATLGDITQIVNIEVFLKPSESILTKPSIFVNGTHGKNTAVKGDTVSLTCSSSVDALGMITLSWETPNQVIVHEDTNVRNKYYDGMKKIGTATIKLHNVTKLYEGTYRCIVKDLNGQSLSTTYELEVLESKENFLKLKPRDGSTDIVIKAGKSNAKWIVDIESYPPATYHWTGPSREVLGNTSKFSITNEPDYSKVEIYGISMLDSGNYTLFAKNEVYRKNLTISVFVEGEPVVEMIASKELYEIGNIGYAICTVNCYPKPTIFNLTFIECENYRKCNENKLQPIKVSPKASSVFKYHYTYKFTAKQIGIFKCEACNKLGCHSSSVVINITDIPFGFSITEPSEPILTYEPVTLICGASAYEYSGELEWYFQHTNSKNSVPVSSNSTGIHISTNHSNISLKSYLHIENAGNQSSGLYTCKAYNYVKKIKNETKLYIQVLDGKKPYFIHQPKNTSIKLSIGDEMVLNCNLGGVPKPKILWFKDKNFIKYNKTVYLSADNKTLKIPFVKKENSGVYKCFASNKLGSIAAEFKTSIDDLTVLGSWYIALVVLVVFAMFCLVVMVFLIKKVKREQKLRKEINEAGLSNFMEGQTESLNPDLAITEQANLLPYDRKWEFPREKLKLGKQIGSGNFGVVMKAIAYGIRDNEESTVVAVKMNSDISYIRDLASELKIMGHLGQHLNVVNLLGACTGNLHKRELLVIVEYCPYGNLHNYLLKNRKAFINQLKGGEIDPNIRGIKTTNDTTLSSIRTNGSSATGTLNTQGDISTTPIGEDGYLLNREMEEMLNGSNENKPQKYIYTSDLLCWAYQIAKGMEYLASRKVLHGDLAARNVLLAEENIVKICDFGLSKNMKYDDIYTKTGNERLPVKWMSIEAIKDKIFSTQSDIWAYGVTLWEIFTLSNTPYPGMQFGPHFFERLIEGYRMEKPQYATEDLYNLMLECWKEQPMLRPSFKECSERIGNMLHEGVKQRYVDLNNPYQQYNNKLYQQSDYVRMVNAPTYANVAENVDTEHSPVDYVNMQPKSDEEIEMSPMLTGIES